MNITRRGVAPVSTNPNPCFVSNYRAPDRLRGASRLRRIRERTLIQSRVQPDWPRSSDPYPARRMVFGMRCKHRHAAAMAPCERAYGLGTACDATATNRASHHDVRERRRPYEWIATRPRRSSGM